MNYLDKFLTSTAFVFKLFNLPHFLKYGFFLFLKKRQIPAKSFVKISNAKIDLNLGDFIDYWIFVDGSYEGDWLTKVKDLVKGKILIDIGAYIGIYPLSLFKEAKFIYAFEPEKENYRRLVHNLKINSIKNVKAFRRAISNRNSKRITLFINKDDKGWHSLSIPYPGGIQRVESITLDYFVRKNKVSNIGLVKIDVEGAEFDVLKGSLETLKRLHPPLLIEFNSPRARLSGYTLMDIYKMMTKNNYRAYRLRRGRLVRLNNSGVSGIYNENVLFIKSGHPLHN